MRPSSSQSPLFIRKISIKWLKSNLRTRKTTEGVWPLPKRNSLFNSTMKPSSGSSPPFINSTIILNTISNSNSKMIIKCSFTNYSSKASSNSSIIRTSTASANLNLKTSSTKNFSRTKVPTKEAASFTIKWNAFHKTPKIPNSSKARLSKNQKK